MKNILFFYTPNHCNLSKCFVGSWREFKLKGSFPQKYPQSFSKRKVSLLFGWLISHFGTNLINIISLRLFVLLKQRLRVSQFFGFQTVNKPRRYVLCPLSTLWSRPIKLLVLWRCCGVEHDGRLPLSDFFLKFLCKQGAVCHGTCLKGRRSRNSFLFAFSHLITHKHFTSKTRWV